MDQAEPASSQIFVFSYSYSTAKDNNLIQQSSDEAYLKMLQTAYALALEPTLPSQQFKTVKVQHENGVRLIEGETYYSKTKSIP